MAFITKAKESLDQLFSAVAGTTPKGYQLLINYEKGNVVLNKVLETLLKKFPTKSFKKTNKESLAKDFLFTEHWLSVIINDKDSQTLEVETMFQKHKITPFVALEIHETTREDRVNVFVTRFDYQQSEFTRKGFIFKV